MDELNPGPGRRVVRGIVIAMILLSALWTLLWLPWAFDPTWGPESTGGFVGMLLFAVGPLLFFVVLAAWLAQWRGPAPERDDDDGTQS